MLFANYSYNTIACSISQSVSGGNTFLSVMAPFGGVPSTSSSSRGGDSTGILAGNLGVNLSIETKQPPATEQRAVFSATETFIAG